MTYLEALATLGLSQSMVELIICIGAISLATGVVLLMFWQYIAVGAGMFMLFTVFAHHQTEESSYSVDQASSAVTSKNSDGPIAYIEECEALTNRTDLCEDIWNERITDGSAKIIENNFKGEPSFIPATAAKLIDTDNQEYQSRRASVLQKPNAVVLHSTFR